MTGQTMKWKKRKKPNNGDTRIKKKFLLFPKCIEGDCRWLEMAKYKQRYRRFVTLNRIYDEWIDVEWVDNERL